MENSINHAARENKSAGEKDLFLLMGEDTFSLVLLALWVTSPHTFNNKSKWLLLIYIREYKAGAAFFPKLNHIIIAFRPKVFGQCQELFNDYIFNDFHYKQMTIIPYCLVYADWFNCSYMLNQFTLLWDGSKPVASSLMIKMVI